MIPKRLSPWICVLVNQAAFPGLGTKLAGRRVGYVQMAVMLVGFCLSVGFMLWFFVCAVRYLQGSVTSEAAWRASCQQAAWAGWSGLGLCATAWCWAGLSSISILRSSSDRPPPLRDDGRG